MRFYANANCLYWLVLMLLLVSASNSLGTEHNEISNETTSAKSKIKNVVFIVSDDLKASVLGCYGDRVCKTPNIDRLAAEGTVFQRAYCQGTWCAPSRQSFMHSRYSGKGNNTNLGKHLQNNGIHTARVGKIYHMRVPGDIIAGTNGLDIANTWTQRFNSPGLEAHTPGEYACLNQNIFTTELEGRESTKMKHRPYVTVQYEGDGSDQPDFKSAEKAIEILRERKSDSKPFFLAVGLVRPHYPMVAPKQYFDPYPWEEIELPETRKNDHDDIPKMGLGQTRSSQNHLDKFTDNQKRMWSGYYASVTFMDEQVGKIIQELDRLGLRDSTAIIFTSDHGYHLGEHDFWQKSNLHEEVSRVPLVISAPGFKPAVTDSFAELVDIYPTVSKMMDLNFPSEVQGQSLLPILSDPSATVRDAALTIHKGFALRGQKWVYMKYNDGSEELYDMDSDPNQFSNLVADPKYSAETGFIRKKLADRLSDSNLNFDQPKKKKK
ncbi:MAG: sulfatase [Mariniblastus sp.]